MYIFKKCLVQKTFRITNGFFFINSPAVGVPFKISERAQKGHASTSTNVKVNVMIYWRVITIVVCIQNISFGFYLFTLNTAGCDFE